MKTLLTVMANRADANSDANLLSVCFRKADQALKKLTKELGLGYLTDRVDANAKVLRTKASRL